MSSRIYPLFLLGLILLASASCVNDRNTYIKGYKLWKNKNYESAVSEFQQIAFKRGPSKYKVPAQFNIGSIYYYHLDRPELAAIEFTKVTAMARENGEYAYKAQKNIADIYRKEFKSYERAVYEYTLLFKYDESREDLMDIFDAIYSCYLEEHLYDDAQKEFERYLKEFDLSPREKGRVYLMTGNLASLRGKWKEAVAYYDRASEIKEFRNEGLFMMAETYYGRKKYKQAAPFYKILLEADYKKNIVKDKLAFIDGK